MAELFLDVVALDVDARRILADPTLGSVDEIHFATVMGPRADGVATGFVTREQRQADAARAEGFEAL